MVSFTYGAILLDINFVERRFIMKQDNRNFVAKHMNSICKNAVHKDKRRLAREGKTKHKQNFLREV